MLLNEAQKVNETEISHFFSVEKQICENVSFHKNKN